MKEKDFKGYCKDAKKRLKNGFWQNYKNGLNEKIKEAQKEGILESKVKEYYNNKVAQNIKNPKEESEEFYIKVSKILDEHGETSSIINELTDYTLYNSLNYEEQQRYNLTLSENYLKALERYKREKALKVF